MNLDPYTISVFIGVAFLILAFLTYQRTTKLLKEGFFVLGTIRHFQRDHGQDVKDRFYPIVEYQDQDQVYRQFQSKISYKKMPNDKGQKVGIVYNPKANMEPKIASYINLYWPTLVLLSVASPFLIIGLGNLIYNF